MSTESSPSDLSTLRLQLDKLITDRNEFIKGLQSKQQQADQIAKEMEQFRGALAYIDFAYKRVDAEMKQIAGSTTAPAVTS